MNLESKILCIIEEKLNIPKEKIQMGDHFTENLGADSLEAMELMMEFEDTFEIDIPEEAFGELKTVQDAVNLVQNILSSKKVLAAS